MFEWLLFKEKLIIFNYITRAKATAYRTQFGITPETTLWRPAKGC